MTDHLFNIRQQQEMAARRGVDVPMPAPEKKRKPRSNEESRMQRQVIRWWQTACRDLGVPEILLFSIPNGGWRGPITGSILKAEGLRRGVPDLMLAVARTHLNPEPDLTKPGFNYTTERLQFGLFIEMKTATGRLLPEQEVYHELLRKHDYAVHVCRSAKEAASVIENYLTR